MKPLNPIMAVLAIASVGVFPLRTLARDGATQPAAVPKGVPVEVKAEDANSITRLTEILAEKDSDARKSAAQRISSFMLKEFTLRSEPGKKSFVGPKTDPKAFDSMAQGWVKSQKPADLAMLYFVVGPGETQPDWVKTDSLLSKTFVPRDTEERLRLALKDYTVVGKGQVVKTTSVSAFLNTSVVQAKKVFDDPRPMPVIDASVEDNNTTAVVAPGTARVPTLGDGSRREYTLDDYYTDGAKVVEIRGPNDPADTLPRKISMKIYTQRDANGKPVDVLGIFDITDTANIFGQYFPLAGGDQTFALEDRKPGQRKFELKFGPADKNGNQSITFARPDPDKTGRGTKLETSVFDLFNKRADQVEKLSRLSDGGSAVAVVGDQQYYVLPQGGGKNGLLFFPKAMIDNRGNGDPRDLGPGLYAEVGQRNESNGRPERVPAGDKGGPHLGKLPNGEEWHLEWKGDDKTGEWVPVKGPGDVIKPPAPKPTDAGTSTGGNTGAGGNTGGNAGGPGLSVKDMLATFFKIPIEAGKCKVNDDDTKDMDPALKDKYGIVACTLTAEDGLQQILIVPKSDKNPKQQMVFGTIEAQKAQGTEGKDDYKPATPRYVLQRARIVDHFLVLVFDKQIQYLDLLAAGDDGNFKLRGFVSDKKAGGDKNSGFWDMVIFLDAMKNYMDVSDAVFAKLKVDVPKNVAEVTGGKEWRVSGSYNGKDLSVLVVWNGESARVWPKLERSGDVAPTGAGPYEKLNGVSNVFEAEVSSEDAPFKDDFAIPEGYSLVRTGDKATDIALYESKDPTGKKDPNKYYLMLKYVGYDPVDASKPDGEKTTKIFRQKQFEAFNEVNPLPSGLQMQGLVTPKPQVLARGELSYRFISGSSKARGVLAAFQNKQVSGDNQKNKAANCVGPIVWWGVGDRAAAMDICKNDKF